MAEIAESQNDDKNPRYPTQTVEFTIDLLQAKMLRGAIIPEDLIWLFQQCLKRKRKEIAFTTMQTGMFLFSHSRLTRRQTFELMSLCKNSYCYLCESSDYFLNRLSVLENR
jgi:hypothetical protein